MNVGITFVDGMSLKGGRAVSGDPSLNGAANAINRLPRAKREAEIAKWKWSGDEETWMAGYRGNVTGAWSSAGTGLNFQSSKTGWESQKAAVNVVVNTQNVKLAGPVPPGGSSIPATAGPIHCQATIYKTPDDNSDFGAEVGGRDASGQTSLRMGSGQTVAHGHLLRQAVGFARGSTTLNAAAKSHLDNIIFSFQSPAGGAGTTIDITGHADTSGGGTPEGDARNQEFSEKRAKAVGDYIIAKLPGAATRVKTTKGVGASEGEAGARGRRVDVWFAGGQGQNTAAHEFGHMLGLDDEYAVDPKGKKGVISGTGGAVGTPNADDARTKAVGMGNSVYENNDSLMSLGSTVKAPAYVSFMEALRNVTSMNDWKMA
jgi:outer membrane protein OmpA-like peptidoglycan-associated protein